MDPTASSSTNITTASESARDMQESATTLKVGIVIGVGGVVLILVVLSTAIAVPAVIIHHRSRNKKNATMEAHCSKDSTAIEDVSPKLYRKQQADGRNSELQIEYGSLRLTTIELLTSSDTSTTENITISNNQAYGATSSVKEEDKYEYTDSSTSKATESEYEHGIALKHNEAYGVHDKDLGTLTNYSYGEEDSYYI